MTSSTDARPLLVDPFPLLADLPMPDMRHLGAEGHMLDTLRARALEEGRAAGFEQGRFEGRARAEAEARAEAADRIESVLARLDVQARDTLLRVAADEHQMAAAAVTLALAIAEAVVGRELALSASPGEDALRRALAAADLGEQSVVARLHPDDLAALGGLEFVPPTTTVRLVADHSLQRGDAIVETATGNVDATIAAAFERVAAALIATDELDDGTAGGESIR